MMRHFGPPASGWPARRRCPSSSRPSPWPCWGPFILGRFAGTIEQRAGRDESIPALAQFCIDRPFAISALVVPACIVGLILWTNPPGRWLLMLLGYALLLIPFGMLLYSVIMLLAGLYSPQPL
jgi:hypothetical protein